MSYKVFDVETTTKLSYGRKANPFDLDNWVVYTGIKPFNQPTETQRFLSKQENAGWFARMLASNPKMIVGFNTKFDILHAIVEDEANYVAYMYWVSQGGIVWDCQLAEYLLKGMFQEQQMLSLDEVAPRYGGTLKVDEVKAMWEAGICTTEIPEDLLTGYLNDDCINTDLIFKGQIAKAKETGQLNSILLNMDSLLYTIEAEKNGMFVDKELGLEIAKGLEAELAAMDAKLEQYIPEDCPVEFNWGNRHHLSPLIFGGTVKYEARQYDLKDGRHTWFSPEERPDHAHLYAYAQKKETQYVLEDGSTSPDPATQGIVVVKSGKNAGNPKTKQVSVDDLTKPKSRMAERFYKLPGFTEPKQEWASSTPGLFSVAQDVIDVLAVRDIPFLKDFTGRAALAKDLGTYYIKYDESKQQYVGMLTFVQPDSIIHHSINHTSTVTTRFSSSKPNLQNVPKGGKSRVKEVFVSRFKEGKIIQSDFTSLEVFVQAILTGDPQLLDDLRQGLDMHCQRVAQAYGVDYAVVVESYRAEGVEGFPGEKVWSKRRDKAKIFSFQRAYGAGAALIAESTGMAREEVDALVRAEEERYPKINEYYEALGEYLEQSKRGVHRVVPHPSYPAKQVELRRGYFRTPDKQLYGYTEGTSPKFVVDREGRWSGFSPTEIKNYVVQGTGATWMKAAMGIHVRFMYSTQNLGGKACIVNTVHDAGYTDAHPDVALEAAGIQDAALRLATRVVEKKFDWPMPIQVPCETVWGKSMAVENPVPGLEEVSRKYQQTMTSMFL